MVEICLRCSYDVHAVAACRRGGLEKVYSTDFAGGAANEKVSLPPYGYDFTAIPLDRELTLKIEEGQEALYNLTTDTVKIPDIDKFETEQEYYSSLFHELTHSTMKDTRCDRQVKVSDKGEYSREELVAEIGSAMLLNRIGIEVRTTFQNSVAYIQNWVKALQNDEKMIVWAASRAEAAARYILGEQEGQ